ncbi:MAG TPA: hypothetical protein VE398_26635 [Acidobacteriota bacterium]|nr:hypothetical protein [Acidobacteriota bacterium]
MNHRKFVVTSTITMLVVAGIVAGLAFYSNVIVRASVPDLPEVIRYLPADYQVVFGMNVDRFVKSPVFMKFQEQHGQEFATNLQEIITKTGVDPTRDLHYLVAAGRSLEGHKGTGVVVAIGSFDESKITAFIKSKAPTPPFEFTYTDGTHVLMIPESDSSKPSKGVAFIKPSEIALGDQDSLKALLDTRASNGAGIASNPVLGPLINSLHPDEMFWFAGDAGSILSKAPTNTPFGGSISAIQSVVGTLNLDQAVVGKITANAKDLESAQKLTDVARGFVALGQLAGDQNPDLTELLKGINISVDKTQVSLVLNFPFELLDKLQHAKPKAAKI